MFFLIRKNLAAILLTGAREAFALLLFTSPLALAETVVSRPAGTLFSNYADFRFYSHDLFLLLTLVTWLGGLLAEWRRPRLGPWFLTLPLAGLVALSWVGTWTGIDPILTAYNSVRFTLLLGLYFFLVNENPSPAWVAIPLALGLAVQSAVALGQFIVQGSLGLGFMGELGLDPSVTGASIIRVGDLRILRAYGLTEHPNILGGFLAFGLSLLLGYYLAAPVKTRWRYALLAPLALGSLGLFLSFSRAAILGAVVGAGLLGLFLIVRPRAYAVRLKDLVFASLVILSTLAVPAIQNRALLSQRLGQDDSFIQNPGEQRSLDERDALLDSTMRIFNTHAWLGVGNGALALAEANQDPQFDTRYYYQPAHLTVMDAAAELGVVGGGLWAWLSIAPLLALLWRWRKGTSTIWLVATAAALLVLSVVGLFDYYPWLSASGRAWQWSAWGLFAAAYAAIWSR